jgi:hypothetical protein
MFAFSSLFIFWLLEWTADSLVGSDGIMIRTEMACYGSSEPSHCCSGYRVSTTEWSF